MSEINVFKFNFIIKINKATTPKATIRRGVKSVSKDNVLILLYICVDFLFLKLRELIIFRFYSSGTVDKNRYQFTICSYLICFRGVLISSAYHVMNYFKVCNFTLCI